MSRIRPPVGRALNPHELPRASLNMREIAATLSRHGVSEEMRGSVTATMQLAADDYLLSKLLEEQGATRAEIHDHAKRAADLARQVAELFAQDDAAARVVYQNVAIAGGPAKEVLDAIQRGIRDYAAGAIRYAASVGKPKREAPAVAVHARQIALAKRLIDWGYAADLPHGTTASSLLAQLLAILLEAVGEPHSKVQDLLDAAKWKEWGEIRPPRQRGRGRKADKAE